MIAKDHGGNLDAAIAKFGGLRSGWLDLSTGINPVAYPIGDISTNAWTDLPQQKTLGDLLQAARQFWQVPDEAEIVAAPGLSSVIAQIPNLAESTRAHIPGPTYNEYANAMAAADGAFENTPEAGLRIFVHPNNPTGRLWSSAEAFDAHKRLTVIDESFCDVCPEQSFVAESRKPGIAVLKSFGKFWGLAGLRLGFAIGRATTLSRPGLGTNGSPDLNALLGPWAVSGPALEVATRALQDHDWAKATRLRLTQDAGRLDGLAAQAGARLVGGTDLFRLYEVSDAATWRAALANQRVWSRIFPYNPKWLRLGLPHPGGWEQLTQALSYVRKETE